MVKKLTEKEWKQMEADMFVANHPVRAKVIANLAKLIVTGVYLAFWFLLITAIYAMFKWAIGVWI